MIAMNIISTRDENRRTGAPVYPGSARSVRHAVLRVLSMVGLGIGGVAAVDDEA